MQLWDQDEQPQSQLIVNLQLDASTVTKMVQRLEQQGFVTRERSETDPRALTVRLTSEGLKLKPKVAEIWAELESLTLNSLTAIERTTLTSILEKVIKNLAHAHNE